MRIRDIDDFAKGAEAGFWGAEEIDKVTIGSAADAVRARGVGEGFGGVVFSAGASTDEAVETGGDEC